jgi:hypothetical protein
MMPPQEFRRFLGMPWRWWRHIPHWHIAVYLNEVGRVKCSVCWQDWDTRRRWRWLSP